ncbi:MAG: dihydrolipoamide acetyltransferase family protein [Gammaproteobacteria bacterium]
MKIFYLPDLGEGLPDAEIQEWYVKVGDVVKTDDPLVSMETAKAIVDVPAPFSGKIAVLHGKQGDIIKTGTPLVSFEATGEQRQDAGTVVGHLESHSGVVEEQMKIIKSDASSRNSAKASAVVKGLAARLGVNIMQVTGTGRNGMITAKDVQLLAAHPALKEGFTPIKGSRRMMLASMTHARNEVCPVTVFDDADISAWEKGQDISARMVRALVVAANAEPALNASFDAATQSHKINKDVHVGIAMDTDEGLFVPVIHHAEKLNATQIREQLETLKISVRSRTVKPEDLHGSTITLSNFGKFAGRYATPIVVPPQLAIVANGPKRLDAVVKNNEVVVCPRMPLSLTFDHRAVTGGEATRFMGALIQDLEKAE